MANNVGISSILVPCVQELLAKEPIVTVPPRYIRSDQDEPISCDDDVLIPVIDMESLLSDELMDSELNKLHFACKDWGFFQLVNHGMKSLFMDKLKKEIQDFLNMQMEEKKKFWQYSGEIEGFGQGFVLSEEQKLDWADVFYMTTLPIHLRKPHLFPKLPVPFRDTLEVYSGEMETLSLTLLSKMAKVLNMKDEDMIDFFGHGKQSMRMNYYPPCPQPDQVIGVTPHTDLSGLTILLQINEVDGLQIKKYNKWIPIKPLPNAFIVNIGDTLKVITNGAYPSIEHRVMVNSVKERLSIATFYGARTDGEIGPARSLITRQTPALFRRVTVQEFFKGLYLDRKSYLDSLRIPIGQ